MNWQRIILAVVVILILYYVIAWLFRSSDNLTTMQNANLKQTILASTLKNNSNTSNFAYSTWFYVDDWNYRFGDEKILLLRAKTLNDVGFGIILGAMKNNIEIGVECYKQNTETGTLGNTPLVHKCVVENFPLQKWVNLTVSVYGRSLDIYIDGKLVRTCVLPGVAKVDPDSDITVTPFGGFHGFTGNFKYWSNALNPQEAYNIYREGFGGSILGNLLNKYRIKIAFLEDNREKGSFEI